MSNVKTCIIVDSSSLTEDNELKDIYMVPLSIIQTDNGQETVYKDVRELSSHDVVKKLYENKNLKTSQTTYGEMSELLEELVKKYQRIYVLPLSAGLSGCYNTWKMVIDEDFKNHDITLIETASLGPGIKDLAIDIYKLVQQNKTTQEILDYVEDFKSRRFIMLILTDLSHLHKGGRISHFKFLAAKLLKFNILVEFNGTLSNYGKDKNLDKAIDKALEKINLETHYMQNGIRKAYFGTTYLEEDKNKELQDTLDKKLNFKSIFKYVPGVISVHTGPRMFCIYVESKSTKYQLD